MEFLCCAQVPVFGQPGIVLEQDSLTLNPSGHASLLVSADTAPSLPVYPPTEREREGARQEGERRNHRLGYEFTLSCVLMS